MFTPPTIAFAGSTNYTVDQTINITCTATDTAPSSPPCTVTSGSGPAYLFGASNTATGSATDTAGNIGTAMTSFTVSVTSPSLCALTKQFVQGSSNYTNAKPMLRKAVNLLVGVGCKVLTDIGPRTKPAQKAAFISAYKSAVQGLVRPGWLTQDQASALSSAAGRL